MSVLEICASYGMFILEWLLYFEFLLHACINLSEVAILSETCIQKNAILDNLVLVTQLEFSLENLLCPMTGAHLE